MRIPPIALVLLMLPVHSLAQDHRVVLPTPQPTRTFDALPALDAGPPSSGLFERALGLIGGAAAGAWIGYMASQVAVSDWEDDIGIDRGDWAAGGAAFGMAVSLTVPVGRVPRPVAERATEPGGRDRDVLRESEIREAEAENLYELIRSQRPEWLRTRGTASIRETPRGRSTGMSPDAVEITDPGIETIRVYLDDSLLGHVDELRQLPPGSVGEVRFLGPAEATQRWGGGHLHGAIHVITAPAS